jgi:hypothetical protein
MKDNGSIKIFGKDHIESEVEVKSRIGFVYDNPNYYDHLNLEQMRNIIAPFYKNWDEMVLRDLVDKFQLPLKKSIRKYSRGMVMKAAIAVASSFFSFIEKKQNSEMMTSNLPVNRKQIVTGRYLTSIIILSMGVCLWVIFAYLAHFIYSDSATSIQQIFTLKVLIITLFFVSLHNGIFLPAIFSFRLLGVVLVFIVALITAIFTTATIFKPYSSSFNFNTELKNLWGVFLILLVLN